MPYGTVKYWNEKKGFGFIVPDDKSGDVFVHATQVKTDDRLLYEKDRVEFSVGPGRDGKMAAQNVRLVQGNAS